MNIFGRTPVLEKQYPSNQIGANPPHSGGPGSEWRARGRKEMLGGSAELVRAGPRCGLVASGSKSPPGMSYDNGESSFDWRFENQLVLARRIWNGASEDISLCWK